MEVVIGVLILTIICLSVYVSTQQAKIDKLTKIILNFHPIDHDASYAVFYSMMFMQLKLSYDKVKDTLSALAGIYATHQNGTIKNPDLNTRDEVMSYFKNRGYLKDRHLNFPFPTFTLKNALDLGKSFDATHKKLKDSFADL